MKTFDRLVAAERVQGDEVEQARALLEDERIESGRSSLHHKFFAQRNPEIIHRSSG
jgi:hypothetical protein